MFDYVARFSSEAWQLLQKAAYLCLRESGGMDPASTLRIIPT